MPIHLKKVSKYVNTLIKTKKGYDFPAYNLTGENSFYFALLVGCRGCGKSNSMLQILNIEKEHLLTGDNIVYWVSPTHDSKVAEFAEKHEDNMVFVDELNIKSFNNIIEDIHGKIDEWKQTKFIFDLFEQYLKKQDSIDEEELNILIESGMLDDDTDVKELIKNFNFHHPARATLVIDDSMGSPLISSSNSKQGKEFTRWAIRHRHSFTNIFIISQYYRGISKNLRNNTNMVMLFPSKDRGTASSIFDEFSNAFGGKKENYEEALDLLDKESVGSFLLIFHDKKKFLRLGFDKQIDFTN